MIPYGRRVVEAIRRTRAPPNIEEATAPPPVRRTPIRPLRRHPLEHVPDHVTSAVRTHSGWIQSYWRRVSDLTFVVICTRRIDVLVSPGVLRTLRATGRTFPFLLGRQPPARPFAVCRGLMPRHVHDGPIRVLLLLLPIR